MSTGLPRILAGPFVAEAAVPVLAASEEATACPNLIGNATGAGYERSFASAIRRARHLDEN
jgi:hypothetical protein